MENQINERIRKLIKNENLSQKKFCEIIEVSWGTLNTTFKRNSNPGTDILIKIADKFPQYSTNWLLTGKGEMHNEIESVATPDTTAHPDQLNEECLKNIVDKVVKDNNSRIREIIEDNKNKKNDEIREFIKRSCTALEEVVRLLKQKGYEVNQASEADEAKKRDAAVDTKGKTKLAGGK